MASNGRGANGAWPQQVWTWSPDVGRWQPEHGKPKRSVSIEVSTAQVGQREAFEYWRDIAYYYFEADPRPPGGVANFKAWAHALATPDGDLYVYESSGISGQRTTRHIRSDEGDAFHFGLVIEGCRRHRDELDGVTVAGPGEFFCYDASRVSRVAWDDHRGLHFCLLRGLVDAAVGKPLPPASQLIERVNQSRLAPFLRSHLSLLARDFSSLSPRERAAMFRPTVDLLLTVIREALDRDSDSARMNLDTYFFTAKRVIQQRFADPNLSPELIASALGCSRSTLYRAFHAHGMTVAQHIRDVRLQEARRRIAASPHGTSIAAIALACGFYDPAYFRRLFRKRFGMSPRDVRAVEHASSKKDC